MEEFFIRVLRFIRIKQTTFSRAIISRDRYIFNSSSWIAKSSACLKLGFSLSKSIFLLEVSLLKLIPSTLGVLFLN